MFYILGEKRIYIIRHGETDYNLKGIVQGSGVNTSLNETGRCQAKAFFEHYKDVPFAKIYLSALKRTKESVEDFIQLGVPYEIHAGLNEISWGEKDGKIINTGDHTYYTEMLEAWKQGEVGRSIDGGESPLDVQKRQKPVVDLILSRQEEDPILICMHGRAIRILLSTLLHSDLKYMDQFEHHNLCLYMLRYTESRFVLDTYNDVRHLQTI